MKTTKGDFLDIIIDSPQVGIIDRVFAENLKQRKILINQEIDDSIVEMATMQVFRYNVEDKGKPVCERKPILIYINSCGGNITDGFSLIDMMLASKTPVYTVNLGIEYSMGFLIGLAGSKRYSFDNSTFLSHDGGKGSITSGSKFKDTAEFYEEMDARIKKYVLSRTTIGEELYDKNFTKEWYMYADSAKQIGVVDYIIGKDCELDEIL